MPQLNRDFLREVFYETVKENGFKKNIDKFMMAGKEPFQLVLDICKKANGVIIFKDGVFAQLPGIEFDQNQQDENDHVYEKPIIGTEISTSIRLFKPTSIALASTITSLDIRSFSRALIPMLKSIDREIKEIYVPCENLKEICEACSNIPNIVDGVVVKFCGGYKFCNEMKFFTFPCQKLTIIEADFNEICYGVIDSYSLTNVHDMKLNNPHLARIHDLTIYGRFLKRCFAFDYEIKDFASFLSLNFTCLKNLNIEFLFNVDADWWKWNDTSLAYNFRRLSRGVKGCISFKLITSWPVFDDEIEYFKIQNNDKEYYKNFSISDTICFKLATARHRQTTIPSYYNINKLSTYILIHDYFIHYPFYVQTDQRQKKAKYDQVKLSNNHASIFKNQRSFKPIQNRFSR